MYAKIINNQVVKYPYQYSDLTKDNANTSFPANMTNELYAEFDVYPVKEVTPPVVDHTKNLTEELPNFIEGEWTQVWVVADASQEEVDTRKADLNAEAEYNRVNAYRNEADPLFFKAQRNEATMEEWIAKVNEIKIRFPSIG
jgi:hypothetical protein